MRSSARDDACGVTGGGGQFRRLPVARRGVRRRVRSLALYAESSFAVFMRLVAEVVVSCAVPHAATRAPWPKVEGSFFVVVLQLGCPLRWCEARGPLSPAKQGVKVGCRASRRRLSPAKGGRQVGCRVSSPSSTTGRACSWRVRLELSGDEKILMQSTHQCGRRCTCPRGRRRGRHRALQQRGFLDLSRRRCGCHGSAASFAEPRCSGASPSLDAGDGARSLRRSSWRSSWRRSSRVSAGGFFSAPIDVILQVIHEAQPGPPTSCREVTHRGLPAAKRSSGRVRVMEGTGRRGGAAAAC